MRQVRLIHINNGLGAGNIGDELMAQGFWGHLPQGVVLDVPLYPYARNFRGSYPAKHRYLYLGSERPGDPAACYPAIPDAPGLLVGDTPVAEFEGLQFPLGFVGPTLSSFRERGWSVDAIAVGVDKLHTAEARGLFSTHYAGIRSWTVRSAACREALLDLGIDAGRIRVAADLAWLIEPERDQDQWAAQLWRGLGVRPEAPLLVVNATHHSESGAPDEKQRLAKILDRAVREHGFQLAFLNNETRWEYDNAAAQKIFAHMKEYAVIVPNEYYSPGEMISLLRPAAFVIAQRYHMLVKSVLAGTVPLVLPRGQKIEGLQQELGLSVLDPAEHGSAPAFDQWIAAAWSGRAGQVESLARAREGLRVRASEAFSFLRQYLKEGDYQRQCDALPPRDILVSQCGGLGDVVLCSGLIEGIRSSYPRARIRLLCREAFAAVAAFFPVPPDDIIPLRFDPAQHLNASAGLDVLLAALRTELGSVVPDVYLSADLDPTWLAWYLAARLQPRTAVHASNRESPRGLLPILLHREGVSPRVFGGPVWDSEATELQRYSSLLQSIGGGAVGAPRWPDLPEGAAGWLREHGLIQKQYIVCFPTGAASSPAKRWPGEHFVDILGRAYEQWGLPVILNGTSNESPVLQEMARQLAEAGVPAVVYTGSDIALLTGLMANAALYLGNDTGPAHLAQAFARPGVIVFGGGCWPAYRPWAQGAVGVVSPLPCFGCRWDCAFGRGLCVESIPSGVVLDALEDAWANPSSSPRTFETGDHSPRELITIEGAAQKYREAQEDRARRFHATVEMEYNLQHQQAHSMELQAESMKLRRQLDDPPAAESEGRRRATQAQTESLRRQQQIHFQEISEAAAARLVALERAAAALTQKTEVCFQLEVEKQQQAEAAEARLAALQNAGHMLSSQQNRIAELSIAAQERLIALQAADALLRREQEIRLRLETRIEAFQTAAQERLAALQQADLLVIGQQNQIVELSCRAAERLVALQNAESLLLKEQERCRLLTVELDEQGRLHQETVARFEREMADLVSLNERLARIHPEPKVFQWVRSLAGRGGNLLKSTIRSWR